LTATLIIRTFWRVALLYPASVHYDRTGSHLFYQGLSIYFI